MDERLEGDVARVMETEPEVLPLLPELLSDLWELGGNADAAVSALRSTGLPAGARVLDLGCGKGAVAVALARELGAQVEGIDAFPPFVEAGRSLARTRGVEDLCQFREGDIRRVLEREADYDAVLLLAVGPLLGDHARTVGRLRRLVRPSGYMVIDDAFLAPGIEKFEGYEGYLDHDATNAALQAHGDRIAAEIVWSAEATRALNRRNTELIRARAERLKESRPELAPLVDRYVSSQERETEVLGDEVLCAMWLLERRLSTSED